MRGKLAPLLHRMTILHDRLKSQFVRLQRSALAVSTKCHFRTPDEILLDRARGHVVSALDPVSGGGHCCIGGGKYDFLVTSTLASQVSYNNYVVTTQTKPHHGRYYPQTNIWLFVTCLLNF